MTTKLELTKKCKYCKKDTKVRYNSRYCESCHAVCHSGTKWNWKKIRKDEYKL